MINKIKGAFSAKNFGVSFSKGFKYGIHALQKSNDAKFLISEAEKAVEKAFAKRYDKNSDTLTRLYEVQKSCYEFRGDEMPVTNAVMLGGIFGLWTFSLQNWEDELNEKDANSAESKVFRSSWGVQNERCTAYSEICCQYRRMVLSSIKTIKKYVIE